MENMSYIGLSQQVALQQQMEMTANNLANMNTPGFKAHNALFSEYINQAKDGDSINQVYDYGSYRDLSTGSLAQTHNPLDLAIREEGYFAVQTPQGIRYTRDGSFALNSKHELVTKSGHQVLSASNGPIAIPSDATQITFSADGSVSTEQGQLGRLKVVSFDNQQSMVSIGGNLYDASQLQEKPIANPGVQQGAQEESNVNPIIEMNRMVELMRLFEASQRLLLSDNDRIRTAIQHLTRV